MTERVGFIGMGIMGQGMTRNLLRAGFSVTVTNRTPEKCEPLVEAGAQFAPTPAAAAAQSDIVVICVSDTPDVEAVLFAKEGAAESLSSGDLIIDCSTISPAATQAFAERLAGHGVGMLDAPISGGSEGARQGTLSIMVGGEPANFDRARPVLEAMGKTITHVGPAGSGQTAKLVNQILVVGTMASMAEALLFAEAWGLDLDKTLQAVSGGAAGSWTLSNRGPQVIKRDWRPGFTVDLQQKDLRLVLEAADQKHVPVQLCSTAFHYYRAVQKQGGGGDGNHAIIKALERLSGIEVGKREPPNES